MTLPPTVDLETALHRCGVACVPGEYDTVAVRQAPVWMRRLWGSEVAAMTLPGAVYVSRSTLQRIESGKAGALLAHEAVHVDQWREYGTVRFLARYLSDYLRGRAVGLPHAVAYRAIRFEQEARQTTEHR